MNRRSFLTISTALAASTLGWPALSRSFAAAPAQSGGTRPKVLTGEGREIYVSLRRQRLWAYENGEELMTFLISSGEPERATKAGNFKIQSKYPEAWSRVWQLHMPYWMGIYNVGRIENGIHAMPLRPGGRLVRWPVGYPASFGCVVAATPDAARLYRWAGLGTPVFIRY
jgi:lipoprotein-anchoring transpeptidase ErfK/SrfK